MTRDELIEAGASALVGGTTYVMSGDAGVAGTMNRLTATFVLDAILPLIADELDAAALAADRAIDSDEDVLTMMARDTFHDAARMVRKWTPS